MEEDYGRRMIDVVVWRGGGGGGGIVTHGTVDSDTVNCDICFSEGVFRKLIFFSL